MAAGWRFTRAAVSVFLVLSVTHAGESEACEYGKKLEEADRVFQSALESLDKGEMMLAERGLRSAIQLNPQYADAYYNIGNILLGKGEFKDGLEMLEKAISLNSNVGAYHTMLGICSIQLGNVEKAYSAFKRACQLVPNDPWNHFNLGLVCEKLNNPSEAAEAYFKAVELQAGEAKFHRKLARALDANGELRRAINYYENLLKFDPKDEEVKRWKASAEMRVAVIESRS